MFRKKLQSYFKYFIQRIFIILYGKIKTQGTNDINDEKFVKIQGIESDTYQEMPYILYKIKSGRIYTDTNQNVAIISKKNLISEASFQHIDNELKNVSFNSSLTKGTPRFKKKFSGKIFNLTQGGSGNNYFHFIFDIVPKIYLLSKSLPLDSIDYFYVPEIKKWQKKIYSFFNIDESRLIDSKEFRHVEADLIYAVSHPWYFKGDIHTETKNIPKWIVDHNRNKFLPFMKKFSNNKKIFLDRSSSNYKHCQIENNEEIINLLLKKGFKSYKVEELDIEEQIYLFNEASIIVGAHGAAFTNVIFCKPRTKIIELIPISHPSKKCERLSKILNLNYFKIKTENNDSDKNFPYRISLKKKNLKEIMDAIDLY